jgi:hypothetical protein
MEFKDILIEMTDYIFNEKGEEVISERHQKDFKREDDDFVKQEAKTPQDTKTNTGSFTDINFEDI